MGKKGSRIAKKSEPEKKQQSKGPAIAAVLIVAVAAVLVGAYCGLCSWVQGNGRLLPGSVAESGNGAVTLDLGKLSRDEAAAQLGQAMDDHLQQRTLTLLYGEGRTLVLTGDLLASDPDAAADYGMSVKSSQPFLKLGLMWLGVWREEIPLSLYASSFTEEGEEEARRLIQELADEVYVAPVDFTYEVVEDAVEVTLGVDGKQVDPDALLAAVLEALAAGQEELTVVTEPAPVEELTGAMLSELVHTEPQAPALKADGTITPAVVGISLDAAEAQAILDTVGPGESCSIPVTLTQPELTGTEDFLYQDLLASCITNLDGVANRSFNVNRTAEFCNNTIIMPGEVFSYLNAIGDPSVANGYKTSTGYQNGLTVEMEGGGACQVSSSLYYCAVYANLEIVLRANHAFSVGYVPNGLDATVYYPSLDFKFRNNTEYPIKIVAYTDGRAAGKVTVQIYGTKTDDTYVVPERHTLSTTPWETVYKPDASIPQGTTKVDVTPYTGYVVETYRCVYDGNGNLISRTFENKSTYAKRDKVILFNPADAASLGLTPEGQPLPSGPVEPSAPVVTDPPVSDPPAVSEDPVVSDDPWWTDNPETGTDPIDGEAGD